MPSEWSRALDVDGYETKPGADRIALEQAAQKLGRALPPELTALYAESDGVLDATGQWWVIWPLVTLVAENTNRWANGLLPARLLAFGDDGTGDPFCFDGDGPDVLCWHPVDAGPIHLAPNLRDFWPGWVRDELTT